MYEKHCLLVLLLVSGVLSDRPTKSCVSSQSYYTITYDLKSTWNVVPGLSSGVATALLCEEMNITGWDILEITTNSSYTDEQQAYGAGFLEGAITFKSIWNSVYTANQSYGGASLPEYITDFILQQDNWIRTMASYNKESSPYWYQVDLVLLQLFGLYNGYSKFAPASQSLGILDFIVYNLGPEIGDIDGHFQSLKGQRSTLKPIPGASHCSVLVKVTPDGKQLLAAHDTWSQYTSMLRQFKTYNFNFSGFSTGGIPGTSVTFSAYPGSLQSTDDFYLISSSKLVVMETTNDVMNDTLYKLYIATDTVSQWIRIIVTNRLASSGKTWASLYGQYNSGTYNNQWQVVDYKLFSSGKPLIPNTLWIVEQIPGYMISADKTDVLVKTGYWASYNIPYFPFVYNVSGYPGYFNQYGNTFSYEHCARANIFRRDQGSVKDIPSFKKLMRYNKYQTDALSLQDACRGVSARCDLNTPWINNTLNGWSAFGGIDSKVVSDDYVNQGIVEAVNGPTWDNQPPFAWTDTWSTVPHFGQPNLFDFGWVRIEN